MAKVQSVDGKLSFMFVGDMTVHHEEWIGSSTTNLHGRDERDFPSSSCCEQMVTDPPDIDKRVLDDRCVLAHRVK